MRPAGFVLWTLCFIALLLTIGAIHEWCPSWVSVVYIVYCCCRISSQLLNMSRQQYQPDGLCKATVGVKCRWMPQTYFHVLRIGTDFVVISRVRRLPSLKFIDVRRLTDKYRHLSARCMTIFYTDTSTALIHENKILRYFSWSIFIDYFYCRRLSSDRIHEK